MGTEAVNETENPRELFKRACEHFAQGILLIGQASLQLPLEVTPAASPAPEPGLLSRSEYAKRARVSAMTIARFIGEGMPVTYAGTRARIDPVVADAWIAARGRKPTKANPSRVKHDAASVVDVSSALARGGFHVKGTAA